MKLLEINFGIQRLNSIDINVNNNIIGFYKFPNIGKIPNSIIWSKTYKRELEKRIFEKECELIKREWINWTVSEDGVIWLEDNIPNWNKNDKWKVIIDLEEVD